jgi:hypothetical protein
MPQEAPQELDLQRIKVPQLVPRGSRYLCLSVIVCVQTAVQTKLSQKERRHGTINSYSSTNWTSIGLSYCRSGRRSRELRNRKLYKETP